MTTLQSKRETYIHPCRTTSLDASVSETKACDLVEEEQSLLSRAGE